MLKKKGNGRRKTSLVGLIVSMVILLMPSNLYAANNQVHDEKLLSGVTKIAAGEWAVYALNEEGKVWAWGGFRYSGLLGNGYPVSSESPVMMNIDDVIDVTSGSKHTLLLKKDGTVWVAGSNEYGQLGIETASNKAVFEPVQVKGLSDIKAISAEGNQSLALQADGTVWQWGITDGVNLPSAIPVKVEGIPSGTAIAAGTGSAMMLDTDGAVHVWGTKLYGMNPDRLRKPTLVSGLKETAAIVTSRQRGAALTNEGTVWTWNNSKLYPEPGELLKPVKVIEAEGVRQLAGSSNSSFSLIKNDGTVWMWDSYWDNPTYTAIQVPGITDAVGIANSRNQGQYALLSNGTVMKWTKYPNGELSNPEPVKAPINVRLNGETLNLVIPPVIIDNVSYVPLRGVFENLGAEVEWYQGSFQVVVKKGNTIIEISSISKTMKVNGKSVPQELNPKFMSGVTMVPLRFISEELGAEVKWMKNSNTIQIDIPDTKF